MNERVALEHDALDKEESNEEAEKAHIKLVSNILRLNSGRKKNQVVEDNASAWKPVGVSVEDLVASLDTEKDGKKLMAQVSKLQKKISAPKPHRIQVQREKRAAAYETSKDEVKRWNPIVDRIQQAEVLDFTSSTSCPKGDKTTNQLVNEFQPQNEVEKEIDQVLKNSFVEDEKELVEYSKKIENVANDNSETLRSYKAKMRAIMSYFEQKHRRINRIKSKKYHKTHKSGRKEKMFQETKSLADNRMEERISLRHKNTSKWVRRQLQRNSRHTDKSAKEAIQEQLDIGRELTLRTTHNNRKKENTVEEDSSTDEDFSEVERAKDQTDTFTRESGLGNAVDTVDSEPWEPFEAEKETKVGNNNVADALDAERALEKFSGLGAERKRAIYTTSSHLNVSEDRHCEEEINSVSVSQSERKRNTKKREVKISENPWLVKTSLNTQRNMENKQNPTLVGTEKENEQKKEDVPEVPSSSFVTPTEEEENTLEDSFDDNDSSYSEEDNDTENRQYLKRAFVDVATVEEDFETVKQQEIDEELCMKEPETLVLPGWGTWGGAGIPASKQSRLVKKAKLEQKAKRQAAVSKRRDCKPGLEHVILSEKRVKQTAALTVPFVPAPFKTAKEYESATRMPLGKEWLRFESYQKAIRPPTTFRVGDVIEPMDQKRISAVRGTVRF
eukprot:jgi/Galph1/5551/GphlegSOOS_G4191.1